MWLRPGVQSMVRHRFNPWLHEYYSRFTVPRDPGQRLSVIFLVGSPDISGGTYVIFEHALWLQRNGVDVTVVTMFPVSDAQPGWHPALSRLRFTTFEDVANERFDIAIATWWPTVMELPRLRFRHAVYFVQSAEPRFYAIGPDRASTGISELTYTFGLPIITIATWLQMYLAFQHGAPSFLARNGIDKSRYRATGPTVQPPLEDGLRVLIEGPIDVPMKGVREAISAAQSADCEEIWLLTSSGIEELPGVDRVFSRVPAEGTGEIYRSCQVLLKLSQVEGMYGPPLEMFHCGGTVVTYDVTGHDEYVQHEVNGLVAPMGDLDAATSALVRLRSDPLLLEDLRAGALRTASLWPDWEQSSREFARILFGIDKQPARDLLPTMLAISGAWSLHDRVLRER